VSSEEEEEEEEDDEDEEEDVEGDRFLLSFLSLFLSFLFFEEEDF